jgi:hypothetical protein
MTDLQDQPVPMSKEDIRRILSGVGLIVLVLLVVGFVFLILLGRPVGDDVALEQFRKQERTQNVVIIGSTNHDPFTGNPDFVMYTITVNGEEKRGECRKSGSFSETICRILP